MQRRGSKVLQRILMENPSKYPLNIAILQWARSCTRRICMKDEDKIYSLSLTGSQIIFMSLSPGVERPDINQFVPILDQAAKSIKISSSSTPTATMTSSGGSSIQADSAFQQPQISDNGSTVGQSTAITNDTDTNIQNTAMDISLAVSGTRLSEDKTSLSMSMSLIPLRWD